MHIEIRHARVVATVAEAGSISKAAAALGLPQPSLTAQLRRIEKAVGGELFTRSRSGIAPTPLGQRLIPMLVDLAARADAVIAVASSLSSGVLRIGNGGWMSAALCQAIQGSLPYWDVRMETVDPAAGVAAVHQGELTALVVSCAEAIASARATGPAFGQEVVVREPICVALPAGHELAGMKVADWSRLAELTWVRHPRGHWFQPVEDRVFGEIGRITPTVLHHVGSPADAMSWVRDTGAAALATPTAAGGDVVLVPIEQAPRSRLVLLWRREAIHHNTQHSLVHALRRYYSEYAAGLPGYWAWLTARPGEFAELAAFLPQRA